MKSEREPERNFVIWIDPEHRIISFREAEGFEERRFSSQEELISYAMEKCSEGNRVQ